MANGLSASLGKRRLIDRSIAHNGGAARAKFGAVAARRRVFPRKSTLGPSGNYAPRKEIFGRAETSPREQALCRTRIIRL
jgi:hypothetical protein